MPYIGKNDRPSFPTKPNSPSPLAPKNNGLFGDKEASHIAIDKAVKKARIEEKYDPNLHTKLTDEELSDLKTRMEDPNFGSSTSQSELNLVKKRLARIAEGKDGLNPFKTEDYKKIQGAKKELGKIKEWESDK